MENESEEDGLSCVLVFTWQEQTARESPAVCFVLCVLITAVVLTAAFAIVASN